MNPMSKRPFQIIFGPNVSIKDCCEPSMAATAGPKTPKSVPSRGKKVNKAAANKPATFGKCKTGPDC